MGKPALYLSHRSYQHLHIYLKKYVYQFAIVNYVKDKEKSKMYKHYLNYEKINSVFEENRREFVVPTAKKVFKKRKELEELLKIQNFTVEDIVFVDNNIRDLMSDFPIKIKHFISYAFKQISKMNYYH